MRTIKIERERWRTPISGTGKDLVLINSDGCGCIMGLVGEACGIDISIMVNRCSLRADELEIVGVDNDTQERAIEINDKEGIWVRDREAKLKELFKGVFTLEFV
jgi:hypothetical protein